MAEENVMMEPVQVDTAPAGEQEEEDEEQDAALYPPDRRRILFPRSQRAFYKSFLAGMRLWQRPPNDHCTRCSDYEVAHNRMCELTAALYSSPNNPEYANHAEDCGEGWGQTRRRD